MESINNIRGRNTPNFLYDVGIEIETSIKEEYFEKHFFNINNIKEVNIGRTELKFRIAKGEHSLKVLNHISSLLNKYAYFNISSGIHIHIDFTEYRNNWEYLIKYVLENKENILMQLDCIGYVSNYNARDIDINKGNWVAIRKYFYTLEYRIFPMTFNYERLLSYIYLCTNISLQIKKDFNKTLELEIKTKIEKNKIIDIYANKNN